MIYLIFERIWRWNYLGTIRTRSIVAILVQFAPVKFFSFSHLDDLSDHNPSCLVLRKGARGDKVKYQNLLRLIVWGHKEPYLRR